MNFFKNIIEYNHHLNSYFKYTSHFINIVPEHINDDIYLYNTESLLHSIFDISVIVYQSSLIEEWYKYGVLHRDVGAALMYFDYPVEYWKYGKNIKI